MSSPLTFQSAAFACGLASREEFCLCCYHNPNSHIQIIRIQSEAKPYFERVVFPGQRLMFQADPQATLDVISPQLAHALVTDSIRCHRLRVREDPQSWDLSRRSA